MFRTTDLQIAFISKALHSSAFNSVWKAEAKNGNGHHDDSIQFFTTCPEAWGGSEELWSETAKRLVGENFQVTANLSFLDESHRRVIDLVEAGVRVEKYRGVPFLWRFHGFGGRWEPALTVAHLRATKPKLAVISQGENFDGYRQIINCRAAAIPYVIICHKAMEDYCPPDSYRDELRLIFGEAERVFFVSRHNQTITEERIGMKLSNAEVIWNPYNVDYHCELPWPTADDGRLHLACVARLWLHDKGQDVLLKVLAQEKWKKRAIDVRFYGNGMNGVALQELSRMLGTDSQVEFCGFSENVAEIWRQCHALILPSRHEGLPLSLIEAMLCGRPAIATNAGGNAEVLEDEVSGFVARACTVPAVDDAMERAWNRRGEWPKIGARASGLIRKKVPQDPCGTFVEKLKEIYQNVVRSR